MDDDLVEVANAIRLSVGALRRRVRDGRFAHVSPPEAAVLSALDREGPASTADLARREAISPQAMGTTVQSLVARGFVERTADPRDGRRMLLGLTADGRRVLRQARDDISERLAKSLAADFSADQLEVLRRAAPLLQRLAERL